MAVPIIGEKNGSYILVGMSPGLVPNTFDVNVDTGHFLGGVPLAVQCLLQAIVFLLPHGFQSVADAAVQQLLEQQRIQKNGGR